MTKEKSRILKLEGTTKHANAMVAIKGVNNASALQAYTNCCFSGLPTWNICYMLDLQ